MGDIFGSILGSIGSAITGGVSSVGSVIGSLLPSVAGGLMSAFGAKQQQGWSADQAQKMMDFQERMSGSAYQRATADMRAAGINPMLAYMQGGASSPVGAVGQSQNILGAGVSSAMSALQLQLQTKQVGAQVANMLATTKNVEADTLNKAKQGGLISADTARSLAQKALFEAQVPYTQASAAQASANAALSRAGLPAAQMSGSKANWWVNRVLSILSGMPTVPGSSAKAPFGMSPESFIP